MLELVRRDLWFRRPHWHTKFFGPWRFGEPRRTPALTCSRSRTGGELNQDIRKAYSGGAGPQRPPSTKYLIVIDCHRSCLLLCAFSISNTLRAARQNTLGEPARTLSPASIRRQVKLLLTNY